MELSAIYVKHILAEYDEVERVQRCIICGEIIHDYRNAIFESQEDADNNKGWVEGEHYVSYGNPQYFWSTPPVQNNETKIVNCK